MKFDLSQIRKMSALSKDLSSDLKRHGLFLREKAAREVELANEIDNILAAKPVE